MACHSVGMSIVIQQDVALAPLTSIGLGGTAAFMVTCETVADLQEGLAFARGKQLPVHVLGGGSNTIFSDSGYSGVVLVVALLGLRIAVSGTVIASAGEMWDDVVRETIAAGLGGLETLSGIPGCVGATPMQNVGAYGQNVSSVITQVQGIERSSGNLVTFAVAECDFGYRRSRFKDTDADRYIITEVTYQLDPAGGLTINYPQLAEKIRAEYGTSDLGSGRVALQQVREVTLALRRRKSMVVDAADPNTRSCGSFFVNPVFTVVEYADFVARAAAQGIAGDIPHFSEGDTIKVPGAWIIEQAGFTKGERRGGVGISANHPLALVNHDGTTKELLEFAAEIQDVVYAKFGIAFEREPVLVV